MAKHRIAAPRVGVVRFARKRVHRVRGLQIALATCALVTVLLVVSTALGRSPLWWFSALGAYALPTVVACVVGVPLVVVASVLEAPRFLIHVALFILSGFALTAAGHDVMSPVPSAIAFGASGLTSTAIGVVYFVRFLRRAPIHTEEGGSNGA